MNSASDPKSLFVVVVLTGGKLDQNLETNIQKSTILVSIFSKSFFTVKGIIFIFLTGRERANTTLANFL